MPLPARKTINRLSEALSLSGEFVGRCLDEVADARSDYPHSTSMLVEAVDAHVNKNEARVSSVILQVNLDIVRCVHRRPIHITQRRGIQTGDTKHKHKCAKHFREAYAALAALLLS